MLLPVVVMVMLLLVGPAAGDARKGKERNGEERRKDECWEDASACLARIPGIDRPRICGCYSALYRCARAQDDLRLKRAAISSGCVVEGDHVLRDEDAFLISPFWDRILYVMATLLDIVEAWHSIFG